MALQTKLALARGLVGGWFAIVASGSEVLAQGVALDERERNAVRVVAVADRVTRELGDAVWPGFRFEEIPLALFQRGGRALLFHAEHSPSGYEPADPGLLPVEAEGSATELREPSRAVLVGPVTDAMNANTAGVLGGKVTAFVSMDSLAPAGGVHASQIVLLVHEAGHAYQKRAPDGGVPRWPVERADLVASYPVELATNNAWGQIEGVLLAEALRTKDSTSRNRAIVDFLILRAERHRSLPEAFHAFENHAELNEGLAEYFGRNTVTLASELDEATSDPLDRSELGLEGSAFADLCTRLERVNVLGQGAARDRFYWTGSAQAFLLDRVREGWKHEVEAETGATLAGLLETTVTLEQLDDAARAARLEVIADRFGFARRLERERGFAEALAAQRKRAIAEAWGAPGVRLIVDLSAAGGAQDVRFFDPMNLTTLEHGVRLHSRMVTLGFRGGEARFERAVLQDLGQQCLVTTLEEPIDWVEESGLVAGLRSVGVVLEGRATVLDEGEFVLFAPGMEEGDIDVETWWERIDEARLELEEPRTAPRWTTRDLSGDEHQGQDEVEDRSTVLFFFSAAPWARPAHAEFLALSSALAGLPRSNDQLRLFLVGTQCTLEELDRLLGPDAERAHVLSDPDRFLQRSFAVTQLPAWVEVDARGRIVFEKTGRGGVLAEELAARLRLP